MKQLLALLLCLVLFTGCFVAFAAAHDRPAARRETLIILSDEGITVNGGPETNEVFTSRDIIYHQNLDTYPSGHAYGEGTSEERHSAAEAAAHTVVNITVPGTYRVTGSLSAGQILVDLGESARYNAQAVVTLILSDADITCTVAPAIVFLNTYECGGSWSSVTLSADTSHAGANLILEGKNTVQGSHVAKIYKDKPKKKKLWKLDGAIHSRMSLNVDGPGSLELIGDNEGISSELHLTIVGGNLSIRAADDGINASEEKVSVITINNGLLRVLAGLTEEGDGIDSNGYLSVHGGNIVIWTTPNDSPLDGNKIFLNGGTVLAFGSDEDAVRGDSRQAALYLTSSSFPACDSSIAVTNEAGGVIFAYDPLEDDFLRQSPRPYITAILSSPAFSQGETYRIQMGADLIGTSTQGFYKNAVIAQAGIPLQNTSAESAVMDFHLYKPVSYFSVAPSTGE